MMLNKVARVVLSFFLLLLTGCSYAMTNNTTKFEWDATESAPENYPMEINDGTFIYKGEKERGLYIPSGGTLSAGWGKAISSHVVGEQYKPLPDRLNIKFFSYTEKQFYQGEFELPYEKILSLFRSGVVENPDRPIYARIMAGIAPGGVVSVWVIGRGDYVEVFFGEAEKVELDPGQAFELSFKDKEDADKYMNDVLVEAISPEALNSLEQNGIPFGLWSRYRNRYQWVPVIKGGYSQDFVSAHFVNGELKRRWYNFSDLESKEMRVVPDRFSFDAIVNGIDTIFQIEFDELEIMEAFEKLGADKQKIYIEFDPKIPRSKTLVRIYNENESISLKKYISKDW